MSSSGKEKKRNVWRTALAVFVAALILCGVFLLAFSSGDSFGRYTATQDVHGTFSHEVEWTLLTQNVIDDMTTTYETDDNGERVTGADGKPVVLAGPTRNLTLTDEAYHLDGDVKADITVPSGTEVTLCLNGYVLQGLASENDTTDSNGEPVFTAGNPAITVAGGGTLHLCDCNSTGNTYNFSVYDSGIGYLIDKENSSGDSIEGGVVTGGRSCNGGGIFVQSGGTMTMNSGTIFGNAAIYDEYGNQDGEGNFTGRGGGVCVLGSLEMSGGNIQHNTAECDGAGLYVYDGATGVKKYAASEDGSDNGSFVMKGNAKVAFNRCIGKEVDYGGGGVFLESGTFSMSGESSVCDNRTYGYGGGVLIEGKDGKDAVFTMSEKASLKKNSADGPGGAVYMYGDDAKLVMNDSADISSNTAGSSGGGIFIYRGTVTMNGGTIGGTDDDGETIGNIATTKMSGDGGGAVFVDGKEGKATFVMNGGNISYNTSGREGGAVYVDGAVNGSTNEDASFVMNSGVIEHNTWGSGGAVYVNAGTFTMSDGEISNNDGGRSWGDGGGVLINTGSFIMSGGLISSNSANNCNGGGGVSIDGAGSFVMSGGEISGNYAQWGGGGVYMYGSGCSFTMSGGTICDNSGGGSGEGVMVYQGTFTMNGGLIEGNHATQSGGGVYVVSGIFNFNDGEITGNKTSSSGNGGGGVYIEKGTFIMSGGAISSNYSVGQGGGVYVDANSSYFEMTDGTISSNEATGNGGGVYVKGTFTMSGGTIGGFDMVDNEIVGYGNTAPNGGGVYVYSSGTSSGTFTFSNGYICYNTATNTGAAGGVYTNSDFTYSHSFIYNNSPENVLSTGTVIGSHAYPNVDDKNIDSFVVWDWENRKEYDEADSDGNLGEVHVTIYCPCGEKCFFDDDVPYKYDSAHEMSSTKYVWYYRAEVSGYDETYTSFYFYYVYRNPDADNADSFIVDSYASENDIPSPSDFESGTSFENDLFKLYAINSIRFSTNGSLSGNTGAVTYTDMYGNTQIPTMGIVTQSGVTAGENCPIWTVTAYDDIELYVYLSFSNTSFNSTRKGVITYSVTDASGNCIDEGSVDRTGTDTSLRTNVTTLKLSLSAGDVLTINAKNEEESNEARLWLFGVEAVAVNGSGLTVTEREEDDVCIITLTDENGNTVVEDNPEYPVYVDVNGTISVTAQGWKNDNTKYGGSKYTWSASSYQYVAYNATGGVLELSGMFAEADTNSEGTKITVSIGGVSASFYVKVNASDGEDVWISEASVDFTSGFSIGTIFKNGVTSSTVDITDKDGNSTGFTAIGIDSSATDIEIAADEKNNTYLKFNGSASTTKGSISYHLKAGTYKVEISYYNPNSGRWAIVMDDNGVRLGDEVYDSQKTTSDGLIHTRVIVFTITEEMEIYIGSESSGLYVTSIKIYRYPGYDAEISFTDENVTDDIIEIVLTEDTAGGVASLDGSFTVGVSFTADPDTSAQGYIVYVESLSPNIEITCNLPQIIAGDTEDSCTVDFTALYRGVATVRVTVYAYDYDDDNETTCTYTFVASKDFTIVVLEGESDTTEVSFMVPSAADTEEALEAVFAVERTIDDNYLFTITNGSAHEMGYTVGDTYGNIKDNISYIDMYGNLATPDQAIYTERNIEDSDDILRFTAKDNIYLYVYVALADTKFGSDRAGNVIYYYIRDSYGNYARDGYGNIIYGSYTVSSLADMWTIAVYLDKGETLVIGYTAASGTNSTLYFFGAEARTYNAKYDVDIEISIDNGNAGSGTNRLELTIYDKEYLEEHTVDGDIVDVDFSVMSGTIKIGDITILDVTDDGTGDTEPKDYEVVVEIVGNGVAKIDYDENGGGYSVTAKGEGVTYVMIAVKVDGVVVAMEKIEVVVTVYEESEEKSGEGDGSDIDDGTVNS